MSWLIATAHAGSTITLPLGSTEAYRVDILHDFLWGVSIVLLLGTTIGMLHFVRKYHQSQKGRETAYILGNHTLEFIWTIIPLILMLFIFGWGYKDYMAMRKQKNADIEIGVTGVQWRWDFQYSNGRKTLNELYVPRGKNVKLLMTSQDVLHSFYLPYMRIKQDVVPGMYTYLNFTPTDVSNQPVYCAEFCGTSHSDMLAKVIVLEPKEFDTWMVTGKVSGVAKSSPGGVEPPAKPLAEVGRDLYSAKGCFACHAVDGTKKIGPALNGIFGHEVEFADGSKTVVDENYIRRSILEPQAQLVKGYPPSMPTFKGLLSEEEIAAMVAFIKAQK